MIILHSAQAPNGLRSAQSHTLQTTFNLLVLSGYQAQNQRLIRHTLHIYKHLFLF
jgi:hypothetical protein